MTGLFISFGEGVTGSAYVHIGGWLILHIPQSTQRPRLRPRCWFHLLRNPQLCHWNFIRFDFSSQSFPQYFRLCLSGAPLGASIHTDPPTSTSRHIFPTLFSFPFVSSVLSSPFPQVIVVLFFSSFPVSQHLAGQRDLEMY
ncbi:hypothetical protein DPSP01_009223 [Paraphaeosphaeria sporulosa]